MRFISAAALGLELCFRPGLGRGCNSCALVLAHSSSVCDRSGRDKIPGVGQFLVLSLGASQGRNLRDNGVVYESRKALVGIISPSDPFSTLSYLTDYFGFLMFI